MKMLVARVRRFPPSRWRKKKTRENETKRTCRGRRAGRGEILCKNVRQTSGGEPGGGRIRRQKDVVERYLGVVVVAVTRAARQDGRTDRPPELRPPVARRQMTLADVDVAGTGRRERRDGDTARRRDDDEDTVNGRRRRRRPPVIRGRRCVYVQCACVRVSRPPSAARHPSPQSRASHRSSSHTKRRFSTTRSAVCCVCVVAVARYYVAAAARTLSRARDFLPVAAHLPVFILFFFFLLHENTLALT